MELFQLEGKNALIIGGAGGIGKGMAMGLAKAGATTILSSRNQASLDKAAKEISEATKSKSFGISADITTVENVSNLVNRVVSEFGHIDILINAAGVNVRKGCLDFEEKDWDLVQDVQLKYVFFMCQAVAKHMIEKGIKGKLINIASISSTIALKNMISYCTAKGGIVQMTKAFALELAPYGICVNAMAPGYTSTEMTKPLFSDPVKVEEMLYRIPQKRFAEPEDYEGIAVYLASECSNYLTGQLITIDGGWIAS
jgi:NAD(P)-dependent dehydrogenase (short-subunit alcohol dehydrogenase family)